MPYMQRVSFLMCVKALQADCARCLDRPDLSAHAASGFLQIAKRNAHFMQYMYCGMQPMVTAAVGTSFKVACVQWRSCSWHRYVHRGADRDEAVVRPEGIVGGDPTAGHHIPARLRSVRRLRPGARSPPQAPRQRAPTDATCRCCARSERTPARDRADRRTDAEWRGREANVREATQRRADDSRRPVRVHLPSHSRRLSELDFAELARHVILDPADVDSFWYPAASSQPISSVGSSSAHAGPDQFVPGAGLPRHHDPTPRLRLGGGALFRRC